MSLKYVNLMVQKVKKTSNPHKATYYQRTHVTPFRIQRENVARMAHSENLLYLFVSA
jgi:hypothetical protein